MSTPAQPRLEQTEAGLVLTDGTLTLRADFRRLLPRVRRSLGQELLVRAAKTKRPARDCRLVDATAGLGEDAFLLAAAGYTVTLFERDERIAALLADALERAKHDKDLADIVERMHAVCGDSIVALPHLDPTPDVVLLDPMFPEHAKAAATKKKFQLLRRIEQPCADAADLLAAAVSADPAKIVIKRPLKGPTLAGARPSYSLRGTAIRYDCIVRVPRSHSACG